MITPTIIIVLVITVSAIILFTTELIPADMTAFLVMVSLIASGILDAEEGLSGFSNVATITVFALLVLSIGLQSTGVVNSLSERLEKITGKNEGRIMFFTVVVVGFLSAFMNNTAIVAIFLPVVIRLAKYANVSVSKFLMPLSFAAMIGGASTIIGTSTNILVSVYYLEHYGESFSIFEFTGLGLLLFSVFVVFMLTIGKRMIPLRNEDDSLTQGYDLQKYLTQINIKKGSRLIGKRLDETDLLKKYRVRVIEIIRKDGDVWIPEKLESIREGDSLLIKADIENLIGIESKEGIKIGRNITLDDKELTSEETVIFEAVIGQGSFLIGKRIRDVDFRQYFGALPLAIRQSGQHQAIRISDIEIQFGDVLLMEARRSSLHKFYNSRDFIVLEQVKKPNLRTRKKKRSLAIVIGVVAAAALNYTSIINAALIGCALLFITGCMSMRYVYRKMDWRVIFLLAGMLPLGLAVEKTGTDDLIANNFMYLAGNLSPRFIISLLFLATTLLTSFMSNNATAILLAPIAANIAAQLGMDAKPFLLTVMFAASTSFATPIGYQTNMLVYGAGRYKFTDFMKVGGLLTLIVWLMATWLIPLFYF